MKIEKISENQMKFILNQSDLTARDIKFNELEYGSEKTQDLFHEMLEQANIEYGFVSESIPLVIEAIPITKDSLMVLVTKLESIPDDDHRASIFAGFKEFKESLFSEDLEAQDYSSFGTPTKPIKNNTSGHSKTTIAIYAFENINQIIDISKMINANFSGLSSVYKYNNAYYLVLEKINNSSINFALNEYGYRYSSSIKSKYHLMEHGECITKEGAVRKYASI